MSKTFNPGDRVKIKKNAEPDFDRGKYATVLVASHSIDSGMLYQVMVDPSPEIDGGTVNMWDWELKKA